MDIALWVIGTVLTIVIAHYYYRKSFGKRLSFFLLIDDQPFARIDPAVRDRMQLLFSLPAQPDEAAEPTTHNFSVIAGIHHLQVIVANTGSRAITFNTAPSLDIPAKQKILDATIIHQFPSDLDASLARLPVGSDGNQKVIFSMKMLNPGDYLVAKFLLSDVLQLSDLKVHLLAEDLPRTLVIEPLPAEGTKSILESIDWTAVWAGAFMLVASVSALWLLTRFTHIAAPSTDGFFDFLFSLRAQHFGYALALLNNLMFCAIGGSLIVGTGLKPTMRRRRVVLPKELRPGSVDK